MKIKKKKKLRYGENPNQNSLFLSRNKKSILELSNKW